VEPQARRSRPPRALQRGLPPRAWPDLRGVRRARTRVATSYQRSSLSSVKSAMERFWNEQAATHGEILGPLDLRKSPPSWIGESSSGNKSALNEPTRPCLPPDRRRLPTSVGTPGQPGRW
jgi:hypothetical protein